MTEVGTLLAPEHRRLLIGGQWRDAESGSTFEVEDPATGEAIAEVADAAPQDGLAALAAAHEAQAAWAGTAPRERGELLMRTYEALVERQADFARLITMEMGKPLAESRAEILYSAEFFRWFAEEAVRIEGRYSVAPKGGYRILTVPKPVGPSVLITPWNFPVAMGARKIGPALAAGCTTVVKPAGQTPLSMLLLARVMQECGAPPGAVNVVTTRRSGDLVDALLADPRVRKLSFTGSTEVGRHLLGRAAARVLRTSMELGGNAPFVVCADADLDAALDGAVVAKMRNMGESCVAANRFLVQEPVVDEFSERLADRLGRLTVGPGLDDGVDVGPMIEARAVDKIEELVADAVGLGAKVLVGGERPSGPGYFYPPTVLAGVPDGAGVLREEVFGPVAPIVSFRDDAEAIARANDTEYGLVAYVYTRDLRRALRYTEELETGMVGINRGLVSEPAAPFGGVKQSGLGREGSHEGIREYLDLTYAALDMA